MDRNRYRSLLFRSSSSQLFQIRIVQLRVGHLVSVQQLTHPRFFLYEHQNNHHSLQNHILGKEVIDTVNALLYAIFNIKNV